MTNTKEGRPLDENTKDFFDTLPASYWLEQLQEARNRLGRTNLKELNVLEHIQARYIAEELLEKYKHAHPDE